MFCTPLSEHFYYCVPFTPAPTPAPASASSVLALSDSVQTVSGQMTVQFPGLDTTITVQPTSAENRPRGFFRLSPLQTSATFAIVPTLKIFDSENQPLVTLAVPGVRPEDWTCQEGGEWPLCWQTCGCNMTQKQFVREAGDWTVRVTSAEGVAPGEDVWPPRCACTTSQVDVKSMLVTIERKTH